MRTDDLVSVDLVGHGLFTSWAATVRTAERIPKRALARLITEAYGGNCGDASSQSYWYQYPKAVLTIVYCGLVDPRK